MVSRDAAERLFLPDQADCLEYLRDQRWPEEVSCPACESTETIKKGTTEKGVQRYRCKDCDRIFNDLTGTVFQGQQLSIAEMFYIVASMEQKPTTQISEELDRTYKTVLEFVHKVQDAIEVDLTLSGVCEADEIYVVAGEKGREQAEPRERGLRKRGAERSNQTNHQS